MTDIRITVTNTSNLGGTFLTPFWFGVHDGSFDVFTGGEAASAGLEVIAEDGDASVLGGELVATDADAQGGVVTGAAGPIATREQGASIVTVDGQATGFLSLAAMLLPSNDAFVATGDAVQLFDGAGNFLGPQLVEFAGENVYDAGTEVNTELDAAFINQTAPNTGEDENGVVRLHPGFNGSAGNPTGEGDQIILGGTNAFGQPIDPEVADFTLPGAEIAAVHINTVTETAGTDDSEVIIGDSTDDLVDGGAGGDILVGRSGYDVLDGGRGSDFLVGGAGSDQLNGGRSGDRLVGGAGDDFLVGGQGGDRLSGGSGDDVLDGGQGNNILLGRDGADLFVFAEGNTIVRDFSAAEGDQLVLDSENLGVDSFEAVLEVAETAGRGVLLDFGDDGALLLDRTDLETLAESDFFFV